MAISLVEWFNTSTTIHSAHNGLPKVTSLRGDRGQGVVWLRKRCSTAAFDFTAWVMGEKLLEEPIVNSLLVNWLFRVFLR
jgi:hypothetical protein